MNEPAGGWILPSGRGRQTWTVGLAMVIGAGACGDMVTPAVAEIDQEVPCAPSPNSPSFPNLPARPGPPARTTGTVPHQQINPDGAPEAIDEMAARIFALPDVESRASLIVEGAIALWLRNDVSLERPECVVAEREVGHIHEDGSIHVTLPHGRIPGAEAAGWIEPHPWSATRPGFEAYVMVFTPRDLIEVEVIVGLIENGLSFVRGD